MLRILNMAPLVQCANKTWFLTSWLVEKADPQHFAYVPTTSHVKGEDGDLEVLHADLEANVLQEISVDNNQVPTAKGEEDIVEDGSPALLVLEAEAENVLCEM